MKKFNLLTLFFIVWVSFFAGCQKKSDNGLEQMHWDRDMCERCKMAISERKFAVQVIDPKTHKSYKFDDIGCAILWFDDEHIPWRDQAQIWITDAKTGKWIDARKAIYTDDSITPMAFGFAAYTNETVPQNHHTVGFEDVAKRVVEIERLNQQKGGN
jgi:nitrous oxide reductase accessory protein NosL